MNRVEQYEELLKHTIGLDDTFRFHCTECGKCCKNRDDILLNPYDLYRIASFLNVEMGQVIQDYCVWYVGQTSKLPVVAVNIKGDCPFLEDNRCRIHSAKPTVCALYPLGRAGTENGIRYIVQDVNCGTDEEEHTVRSWLSGYGLEDSEVWFVEWQKTILPLTERMNAIAEKTSERILNMIAQGLLVALYVNYDRKRPFLPQFKENVRKIDGMLTGIEGTIAEIKHKLGSS